MSMLEAIIRQLANQAVRGDFRSMHLLLVSQFPLIDKEPLESRKQSGLSDEAFERMRAILLDTEPDWDSLDSNESRKTSRKTLQRGSSYC
jgi:hypothetical protein